MKGEHILKRSSWYNIGRGMGLPPQTRTFGKTLTQSEENINAIPEIKVYDCAIKEINIEKTLIVHGDSEGNPPIYIITISIIDDTGGRHKVTNIKGMVRDKLEIRV